LSQSQIKGVAVISILILIVVKALPFLKIKISPIIFTRISAIIFIYAGVLSLNTLYFQQIGSGIGIYSGLFQVTTISQFSEVFLLIIGSLILISWPLIPKLMFTLGSFSSVTKYEFKEEKQISSIQNGRGEGNNKHYKGNNVKDLFIFIKNNSSEYCLIVLFSTLGASLLMSSFDLISMYLSIELQSFGLYILSTLHKDSESSTSAGLKYFLLGGLSSCLILLGSGLIYAFTGLTNFESIYSLISVSDFNYIIQGLSLGLILIIVGFLFKISAAPLHNWSPEKCYGKTLNWVKLSNSGDILKLIIPNYNRKVISGQIN
jgi:NADH-ubiquinone oxidoreductase chain 2